MAFGVEYESSKIIAAHEQVIKKFLDDTYEPSKHTIPKAVVKAEANYLFQMMRLCEKVFYEFYEREIKHSSIFYNWYQWYEAIIKEYIYYVLYTRKLVHDNPQNEYKATKQKSLELIRKENMILRGSCKDSSPPQNIYKSCHKHTKKIWLLIEVSLSLIISENQSYSEFYKTYYVPFCDARHEYKLARHNNMQLYCFDGSDVRIRQGSGHHAPKLPLDNVMTLIING